MASGKCAHEDSRLSCIECSAPICTNCMVQCPVGFRCGTCVGNTGANVKSRRGRGSASSKGAASPLSVAKTLGACAAVGCGAGWIMPFIAVPYISCILCFFLGLFAGQGLAKVIDYNIGHRVGTVVVFGLLIGLSLSPCSVVANYVCLMLMEIFTGNLAIIIPFLNGLVALIFCPVCFLVGVLRPTIWSNYY